MGLHCPTVKRVIENGLRLCTQLPTIIRTPPSHLYWTWVNLASLALASSKPPTSGEKDKDEGCNKAAKQNISQMPTRGSSTKIQELLKLQRIFF